MNMRISGILLLSFSIFLLSACVTTPMEPAGITDAFKTELPRSVLIVPVVNNSLEVNAADFFLATISKPVAERGYYVYPVNMVKRLMEDDGLSDANMVHQAPTERLAELFGSDAVMYVTIENWTSEYAVFATTTVVEFDYVLKSGKTGEILWQEHESRSFTPQNNNSSGNPLADLIASAIVAAIERASPEYMSLARQANGYAIANPATGIPFGPYFKKAK